MKRIPTLTGLVLLLTGITLYTGCSNSEKEEIIIRNNGLPGVSTNLIYSSITATSVIIAGEITSHGSTVVTERGFMISGDGKGFGKCAQYTMPGTDKYTYELTSLIPGRKYMVKAYAVNSAGTAYGNIEGFTTLANPEVSTLSVRISSPTTAEVDGSIMKIYPSDIDDRGICYGTSPNPTTDGPGVVSAAARATGNFTCNLENLIPGTRYYARAYVSGLWAVDGWGGIISFYGNEIVFVAGDVN